MARAKKQEQVEAQQSKNKEKDAQNVDNQPDQEVKNRN